MKFSAKPTLAKNVLWMSALAGLLILIFTLWAPFGLRRMVWQDSWVYSEWLQRGLPMFYLNSRPLNFLAWAIALPLTPDSFVGLHSLMIALFMLKGALIYGITRRLLPENPSIAFITMIVAVIYPADTGLYNDGYLNLHMGFVSYLAALYALLLYWGRPRWWKLTLMWGALALSVFTYEAVHALVAATPLLLLWYERRVSKRLIVTAFLWYIPEIAYGVYVAGVVLWGPGLQTREAGLLSSGLTGDNPVGDVLQALVFNIRRHFVDAWVEAVRLSPINLRSPLFQIAVVASAVLGSVFWFSLRGQTAVSLSWRRYLTLLLIGIIAVELGYFMMSLSSVRYDGWRTAFYTILGAGLVVACVIYATSLYLENVGWLVLAAAIAVAILCLIDGQRLATIAVVGIGLVSFLPWRTRYALLVSGVFFVLIIRNLDIQRWVTDIQLFEQDILGTIVQTAPDVSRDAVIVLLVHPENPYALEHLNNSLNFQSMLRTLYNRPDLTARICQLTMDPWGWNSETCYLDEAGVHITIDNVRSIYRFDRVIFFEFREDWQAHFLEQLTPAHLDGDSAYDPDALIDYTALLPSRYNTMFNPRSLIAR